MGNFWWAELAPMAPWLGRFALLTATLVAVLQSLFSFLPFSVLHQGVAAAARVHAALVLLAFVCLGVAFLADDFSVVYVAQNSNVLLPVQYKLSAIWGAHEGSLLLWVLILSSWTVALTLFGKGLERQLLRHALGVLGLVSIGFLLFMLLTSDPFARQFPVPEIGRDLNPLLQDPGLIFHPPMLYMGYVGFSVVFALACAALLAGRLDTAWAHWSRPWALFSWVFLTLGITLGSWWAYHELGWGGWWFWDPVENASFMPWLVGTALIHALAVSEKRDAFKKWSVLLAILAFSLSLLGTFLVRSGVLISVHTFATDPGRGVFILLFLALVVGGALTLYAFRARKIVSTGEFQLFSRETFLLLNNVFLTVAAASILVATLYPLLLDALDAGKISVGPPYFELVFIPLALPLVLLAVISPRLRWQQASVSVFKGLLLPLTVVLAGLVVIALLAPWELSFLSWFAVAAGLLLAVTSLWRLCKVAATGKWSWGTFCGMSIAHVGVGLFAIGVALNHAWSQEKEVLLSENSSVRLAGYELRFHTVLQEEGANYLAQVGAFEVFSGDEKVADVYPEKRVYLVQDKPMTEAAIYVTPLADLYVAIGEETLPGRWVVRAYYRPFIRWVWFGTILMALGGLLAALDRRYRFRVSSEGRFRPAASDVDGG